MSEDEIIGLFEFIDWVSQLDDSEEKILWEEVTARVATRIFGGR